ncbi:dual OB domain-containing protein [Actinophytocola algeriensis]|uniref:Dual OB-containing domain-containing protein n=1 Tax=Actinophytocola algeriensis TaxID=1768010 RepID=A0A7W7QBY2_9PSEU|nr:hypothetical protein [Actinophytocola algeriensis]MBB4910764.1 hypothetical protein [Actinophytocola algeriensis]MBE1473757.1 hypothetical protein [Actinophytocola algeriensis]
MTMRKTIVCLANSRKNAHRCVAGIEFPSPNSHRWIRPIGDRDGHGVSGQEIALDNGAQPQPLDVLEIGLTEWRPEGHQQENYLLDANTPWRWLGQLAWLDAIQLPMSQEPLWVNGSSTFRGLNDRIIVSAETAVTDSLRLIRSQVTICVSNPYDPERLLEVRASFQHAGEGYRLKVTDPTVENMFRPRGVGQYPIGDAILTISLGEEWQGELYKLVAAVVAAPPV